ncbi:hypothetical protein APHAL10511_003049 [Amanita phalloides]|nr:hypothetical protein APHAL10511_003049 [Amanita phalloides]
MRSLFFASLVVAGIFASSSAATNVPNRRKSLGFGPDHPHRAFYSSPYQIHLNSAFAPGPNASPLDVARRFVEDQLATDLADGSKSFHIRTDSYTDQRTGVTHVYVRQLVNGLQVVDGDININIKDGLVLSYGNSFYSGPAPAMFEQPDSELLSYPHSEFCEKLINHISAPLFASGQVPMGLHNHLDLAQLDHIYTSNCLYHDLPDTLSGSAYTSATDPADFRPALLQFMMVATPKDDLAQEIQSNFAEYLNKMYVTDTSHLAPTGESVQFLAQNVPDAVNPVKVGLAYIQVPNKDKTATKLALVWKFVVEMKDNWYEAAVSATVPHRIISVVDWAHDSPVSKPKPKATYNVFKWGINDPECGQRSFETEIYDTASSPVGWHSIPYSVDPTFRGSGPKFSKDFWRNTTTTWGNNIFAQEDWEGRDHFVHNHRPVADEHMTFDYAYDPHAGPGIDPMTESKAFVDAAITQLFYTTNLIHDIYYRYGFDEVSGNFQQYNFGKGGEENDAVIADAQDGSGMDNANFMTPPDGQNGRMRMYLWNMALPYRDGDLEAGIVIHEYTHGLSTRLTGGPAQSSCLGWGEAGGMGEGWGDYMATMIRSRQGETEFPMGAWASNKTTGIRKYVYSTNSTVNPSHYKTLDEPGRWGVHAMGEIWAEMLWVVTHDMIKEHGYSDTLYPPLPLEDGTIPDADFYRAGSATGLKVPKHGNTMMMQLVISALKLQPCRPMFFDARDAIIQADQILTGGENFCTLWKGFAKRGLGVDATIVGGTPWGGGSRTNGFSVPKPC